MTWEVLLRPRAEADLKAARDGYEEREPGLGEQFIDAVAAAMAQLSTAPAGRGDRAQRKAHAP